MLETIMLCCKFVDRELNKAYAGWAPLSGVAARPMPPVATGNWGCGAFGGDKRLKALLQLMVCTRVCRPLVYYTFGDRELRTELLAVWRWLGREHVTVGERFLMSHNSPPGF